MMNKSWAEFSKNYQGQHYSELLQDLFVLFITKNKQKGFFVEFGVMDGKFASNSYLLEKEFAWNGILAEPGKKFHDAIRANRTCYVDHRAVAGKTGQILQFQEMTSNEGMSGLTNYFDQKEMHYHTRSNTSSTFYEVETISLNDLLDQYRAPDHIDYISVDTEGSEPAILEEFDFHQRCVDFWTIEHNHLDSARNKILDIMTHNGYCRIMEPYSKYDDWYIRKELLS